MTACFENDARFAYLEWLAMEARLLRMELFGELYWVDGELTPHGTFAGRFHLPHGEDWRQQPKPSTRAELVLVAAGVVMPQPEPPKTRAQVEAELAEEGYAYDP